MEFLASGVLVAAAGGQYGSLKVNEGMREGEGVG